MGTKKTKPSRRKLPPGLYEKSGSPYLYASWIAPVIDPVTGRMERRGDGTPRTKQVHKSTKEKLVGKAKAKLERWRGEAQRLLSLSEAEEEDRIRARKERDAHDDRVRRDQARLEFLMKDLRDLWLKHAAPKKTIGDDAKRFETILDMLGEDRPIAELTTADVIAFRDKLRKKKTIRGTPHTKATTNRYLALLKSALKAAENHGHEHQNPMRGVKLLREDNQRDRICTPAEYRKLLKAARPELRLAIVIAYHTGARRGVIASLNWNQIDLEERTIRLNARDVKTGEPRTIPMTKELVAELAKIEPKRGPLFSYTPRKEGRDHGAGPTLSSWFSDLAKELEIPDLRFHDFRHTAATNLRRAGADIFTIAAITGHRDLAMLRRYLQVTPDDLREAVDRAAERRKP